MSKFNIAHFFTPCCISDFYHPYCVPAQVINILYFELSNRDMTLHTLLRYVYQ